MDLVVDANVIFSAAIKDSNTAELMLRDDLHLHAPEYLFEEFGKYKGTILKKTHRSRADFEKFVEVLRDRIRLVPREEFRSEMKKARRLSPDPKDVPYFALALKITGEIWSDDKELKNQDEVSVITTTELHKLLGLK